MYFQDVEESQLHDAAYEDYEFEERVEAVYGINTSWFNLQTMYQGEWRY